MKVAVIPDAAMIVVPLIEKNGHEYISPTNFSKYNNMDVSSGKCDDTQAPYTLNRDNILLGSSYFSNELPSGVKGRSNIIFQGFGIGQMHLLFLVKGLSIIKECMMY